MLDDFDVDFPEEEEDLIEEEDGAEPKGRNRTFLLVAGGLGALIVIALICIAIWQFLIKPNAANRQSAFQTQTAVAEAAAFQVQTQTAAAMIPTDTPTPVATDTPEFTDTPVPTATEEVAPDDGTGGGPTPDPRTATVEALLTQAALAQTQAAQELLTQTSTPTATGLPDTGFADDLSIPAIALMAALLILVIFVARGLRASTT